MSQIEKFNENITDFVLKSANNRHIRRSDNIRHHTDKLAIFGDFGFPITKQSWYSQYHKRPTHSNDSASIIDGDVDKFKETLIKTSSDWILPINRVDIQKFRCSLFLNRAQCFRNVLEIVLFSDPHYGRWKKQPVQYDVQLCQRTNEYTLTEYRCKILTIALINLLEASGFLTVRNGQHFADYPAIGLLVTSSRHGECEQNRKMEVDMNNNSRRIICGTVKSRDNQTPQDFIQLRSKHMHEMAELKYGEGKNCVPYDFNKLGAAIVTFELLNVKYNNVIDLEKSSPHASAQKNAAFILYNVARLQCLLGTFDKHVSTGYYNTLPAFNEIDFRLLEEEEEWQMFHVYVIGLPSLLERCISDIDCGRVSIHLLCSALSNLAALFSVYYHRIKILTENLQHLMPMMYARIYLLKALRVIFSKMLAILEIEPINQM